MSNVLELVLCFLLVGSVPVWVPFPAAVAGATPAAAHDSDAYTLEC